MIGFPKPQPRLKDRIEKRLELDRKIAALKSAVWKRDGSRCRYCRRRVRRTWELVPERGEVHHVKPRSVAPDLKYDPENCVLLCVGCDQRAQRHEITV